MQNFEKRLKYNKYRNMNNIITVDLHNGYTVIAIIGKDEKNNYDIELRLKENTVEKWDLIEKVEHLKYENCEKIHTTILKTISDLLNEGFFNYYIDRYQYELKCFDIGSQTLESDDN